MLWHDGMGGFLNIYGAHGFDPHRLHNFGNPCQYRPMGGLHVVVFHWMNLATYQYRIGPLVHHLSTYNWTTWMINFPVKFQQSCTTCHPCSGDTCHSFFPYVRDLGKITPSWHLLGPLYIF